MNPVQRKVAVLVASASAVALLMTAGFFSDGIRRAYHLARLRREPVLLERSLVSGDPAQEAACRDFLQEPGGKRELLALFLWEFERTVEYPTKRAVPRPADPEALPRFLRDMLADPTDRAAITIWEKGHSLSSFRGGTGSATWSMTAPAGNEERRRKILEFLAACAGEAMELPENPGLSFLITPADAVRAWCGGGPAPPGVEPELWKKTGFSSLCSAVSPEARHVCLVTIDRGAARFQPEGSG